MNNGWVIDSSIGISWVHPNQSTPATEVLLDELLAGQFMIVPMLWFTEMANSLLVLQRRKKLLPDERKKAIQLLESLQLQIDDQSPHAAFHDVSSLAETHDLTVYDATYLEIALRRKLALATRDEPLQKAAKRLGIKTL